MLLFLPHKRKKGNEIMRSYPKRLLLRPQNRGGRITRDWKSPNQGAQKSPNRGARRTGGLKSNTKGFHHLVTSQPRRPRRTPTAYL